MASIRQRMHRLESRTTTQRAPACVAVQFFIPDNGRGGPGPGTYRCGPAALTIYELDEDVAIHQSSSTGRG
jgi:hypothetical protein